MINSDDLSQSPINILVAEDNAAVREIVVRAIQSDRFHIDQAEDGQQALEFMKKKSYAVLVTDIVMPHVDGIALALTAMQQYPDLKIIMISGYVQERMRAHNLDALVHRIIAKPFSLEEITEAVEDVLEEKRGKA